jgi:hypothetical protein
MRLEAVVVDLVDQDRGVLAGAARVAASTMAKVSKNA